MQIKYGDRITTISGELTFDPPVFYADLNSFGNWIAPNQEEKISEEQKKEIIGYISNYVGPTKVIFD